jgi:uncharacterized protein YfaS (alpha-2-macroglobulin family)
MKLTERYPQENCMPKLSWYLSFTNPIDTDEFKPEEIVSVKPEAKKLRIQANGKHITITGAESNTVYTVKVNTKLKDIYGQNLNEELTLTFSVGARDQMLISSTDGLIVMDPSDTKEPSFEVNVVNIDKLRVILYQVTPEDYEKCPLVSRQDYYSSGKKVSDEVIETKAKTDIMTQVSISITKALQYQKEKLGHVFVHVEPFESSWRGNFKYRPIIRSWIQGISIFIL